MWPRPHQHGMGVASIPGAVLRAKAASISTYYYYKYVVPVLRAPGRENSHPPTALTLGIYSDNFVYKMRWSSSSAT